MGHAKVTYFVRLFVLYAHVSHFLLFRLIYSLNVVAEYRFLYIFLNGFVVVG